MPINYKNYHPDWKDVIRPAILARDKYKCKFCGLSNRCLGYRDQKGNFVECDEFLQKWAKKNGQKLFRIVLTIMHLDHNIENNDYANLAAGCQQCHNRYDAKHRAMNRIAKKTILIMAIAFSLSFNFSCTAQVTDWTKIEHFNSYEFDCSCHKGSGVNMQHSFVRKLDLARELSGVKFIIVSGYRSESHNHAVGGVLNSSHVTGYGADIYCTDPEQRYKILFALMHVGFNRIGVYKSHIHVDNDTQKNSFQIWHK